MCLLTIQKKALIADKDIKVYKVLTDNMISPYQRFQFEKNILYKTRIKRDKEKKTYCYDDFDRFFLDKKYPKWTQQKEILSFAEGFHSTHKRNRIKDIRDDEKIYCCIIPRGSRYYIGVTDLVISNQIIIK